MVVLEVVPAEIVFTPVTGMGSAVKASGLPAPRLRQAGVIGLILLRAPRCFKWVDIEL